MRSLRLEINEYLSWTPNTAITCPALTTPANGNAPVCSDTNNFGSVCNFSCSVGFGIVGASSLTCSGDGSSTTGSYDNPAPTCEGQLFMPMNEIRIDRIEKVIDIEPIFLWHILYHWYLSSR